MQQEVCCRDRDRTKKKKLAVPLDMHLICDLPRPRTTPRNSQNNNYLEISIDYAIGPQFCVGIGNVRYKPQWLRGLDASLFVYCEMYYGSDYSLNGQFKTMDLVFFTSKNFMEMTETLPRKGSTLNVSSWIE